MKRLTYIVVFLVGGMGVFARLSQSFSVSWEPQLRAYLESTAGGLTHTHVQIDSISLAFFHRVRLLNLRISEPDDPSHPFIQAAQIELTLSLIDLPRAIYRRHPYEAIGLISVENPWIRISPQTIARHLPASAQPSSLPPWFTLVWSGGAFQWKDIRAPHGTWTLYKTKGIFRIRGPRTSLMVQGMLEEARQFRFQLSSLGHRWNAQMSINDGQLQGVLTLLQTLSHNAWLPGGWTVRGGFHLESRASGRRWPKAGDDWSQFLDKATLTLVPNPAPEKVTGPSVALLGTLVYKNKTITGTHLAFQTPWMDGKGQASIFLEGIPGRGGALIEGTLSSGMIGHWPYQDAKVQVRYAKSRWDFIQNELKILDGRVSAKGYLSSSDSDLTLTAQNISLAALGKLHGIYFPDGSLNASCALKGPLKEWDLAGAWWLTGVQWGHAPLGDARGDFEISADHFQAEAKSDQSHFRVALAGSATEKAFELEQLEIALPSGASFSGVGRLTRPQNKLQGTFDASHISLPSDLPFLALDSYGVSGALDAHGQWSGTLEEPVLHATAQSDTVTINHQPLGASSIALVWQKSKFEIPDFHMGPGITGHYQKGLGSIKIQNAHLGTWNFSQGAVHFTVTSKRLDVSDFALQTQEAALSAQGHALWDRDPASGWHVSLEGKGGVHSLRAAEAWDVPFDFSGQFKTAAPSRQGQLHFNARLWEGQLHGDYDLAGASESRLTAHLENARWRAFPFSSDLQGTWSHEGLKPLTLHGHFKTGGDFAFNGLLSPEAQANGTLKLDGFNLRPLGESLHFPKPLEGVASATLTLSGPLTQLKWNGHLEGAPVIYSGAGDHPLKIEQLSMDMTMAPSEANPSVTHLTLNEGQAKTAEELIRFSPGSFIEFAGDKPARLALGTQIRNLHLGIFTLFGGLDLAGTWQIKPQGFAIQAQAQTHSLFINDYELEEGLLLANYYDGILQFSAPPKAPRLVTGTIDFHKMPQLKFTDLFISGKDQQGLQFTGNIGPTLWDFKMTGQGLDMGTLGELSGFPYPMSGAADVQVHGTGDPDHPHVEGKVDLDRGTVLGLSYRSGSAAFVWQDARITFTKLVLSDPGHYTLEGAGVFPLRKRPDAFHSTSENHNRLTVETSDVSHNIDFSMHLKDSNLSLLKSFSSEVKDAKGPVEGLLQIKGTLEEPEMHGSLRVSNGEILGAHYFRQLRNANLALEFEGETVTIKDLRGKSGEGEFRGSGTIVLAGFVPSQYDVHMEVTTAKGVEVQVPELAIPESPLAKRFKFLTTASKCDVRGHVALRGPAESPTFSGEGIFSNGHFTFPPSHKHPPSAALMEWFHRIYWDVNLKFLDGAWFENELVQANVIGQLALKGPSDKLQVNGGLDITEGKISYLGLQFDIQQAHYDVRSDITGDTVVNTPFVRGVAESQIQAVDTVSGVSGTSGGSRLTVNDTITLNIDYAPVDQIKPRLTSAANPTMSQDKLLARVTQTDVENLTPQERNYLYQKQLVSLIDTSLTTPLAQNVLKKTGLADRLRVQHVFDPNAVTGQDLNTPTANQQQSAAVNIFANTKYTIEKDLSTRLSLGYGVRFVPSATSVDPELQQQQKLDLISDVQLSYRWFRNVYLKGDFDLPSSNPNVLTERKVTIEPRWRFGWWGNTNKDKTPKKAE